MKHGQKPLNVFLLHGPLASGASRTAADVDECVLFVLDWQPPPMQSCSKMEVLVGSPKK